MDCRKFYEQVVRLKGIEEIADRFVLVRLDQIQHYDLNLFDFDYDLTMMIFLMNANEQIYGRYGGRDATSADRRQSLAGLKYAMQAALVLHGSTEKKPRPSPRAPFYIRQITRSSRGGGCLHCHDIKEIINRKHQQEGTWTREMAWRYPLPETLGWKLEVDRGNVVRHVKDGSSAAAAGLRKGDVIERLGGQRIRSLADAQYALDKAPLQGSLEIAWLRNGQLHQGTLGLAGGWRESDIRWRPSMYHMIASARVFGEDLDPEEKRSLGLSADQMAFRQKKRVPKQARLAGVQPGDIILGFDNKTLKMDAYDFQDYVRREYLAGDQVTVNIIRDGKRTQLSMKL